MHPARPPPRTPENGKGCGHSQVGEAWLLQGPSLPTISLLDVISELVERTAAHLAADHLERRKGRGLHGGQFGCQEEMLR